MDDIHFQYHVLVHEVRQCRLVGDDTAHLCCGEEYIFGLFFGKEAFHGFLTSQVQLFMCACDDIRISLPLQFTDNGRTDHAPVTGHIYFSVLFHYNSIIISQFLFPDIRQGWYVPVEMLAQQLLSPYLHLP